MKKVIVATLITVCVLSLSAQKRYSVTINAGAGISMSSPDITPFGIETMAHYNLNSHWALGGGTGFGQYDNISVIPLYANMKYTINPQAKYNVFADCSAGYGFAPEKDKNGGFLFNPEFGVQHKLWDKIFSIAVGYESQKLERLKSNSDNYVSGRFVEKLDLSSVSLKLGIIF
ncbi:MAG: porin family protein [Tannerella sp.]|jgi:hypothetical protein|nr:porin family protein [Tannerella sp.]